MPCASSTYSTKPVALRAAARARGLSSRVDRGGRFERPLESRLAFMVFRKGLHRMNCAIEVVGVPTGSTPSSAQIAPVAFAAAAVTRALAAAATTTDSSATRVAAAATSIATSSATIESMGLQGVLQAGRAETADSTRCARIHFRIITVVPDLYEGCGRANVCGPLGGRAWSARGRS